MNKNNNQKIQKALDENAVTAQKQALAATCHKYIIGALALIMMLNHDFGKKTPKDDILCISGYLAIMLWGYMRTVTKKTDAENRMIYTALRESQTPKDEEVRQTVQKNSITTGIITLGSMFTTTIPILAVGCGALSQGVGFLTAASIIIACETYAQQSFKKCNLLLKSRLSKNIIIPDLRKNPFRER